MGSCGIANDNKFYIQPNEVCAFRALKTLKNNYNDDYYNSSINEIFSKNFLNDPKLNKDYRKNPKTDNDYIYQYNPNKKDLCYKVGKNEWTINCAIKTNNPSYTFDNENKNCTLIPNIKLNQNFSYEKDNTSNYITFEFPEDENNKSIYRYKNKNGFCENKWYDWIITPNYHFGNQYEKDIGNFTKEDIRKCYSPCIKGYLPYFNNKTNEYICIPKDEAEDGLFANKLDYSPVALINLIGNSDTTLYNYTFLSTDIVKFKYLNNSVYEFNNDAFKNKDNNYELNKAKENIKNTINSYFIDDKSMNARNIDKNINVITYKNPLFNENDPELITLRGMDTNGMMIDEILIHTYYLAYQYNKFYEAIIKKTSYFKNDDTNNVNFDKLLENNLGFNIKYILKSLKYEENKNKNQRLANILFKAINICYDEKTDFSKNLLDYTRLAFNKYKNIDKEKIPFIDYFTNYFEYKRNYYNTLYLNEKNNIYLKNTDFYYELKDIEIKKLEIPFITSVTKEGNSHISNYILEKLTDITDEKQKNEIRNFFENRDDIIFYTLEDKERVNRCSTGEIFNKETNNCDTCKSYCTIEKCKTDKNCGYFCEDVCTVNKEKAKPSKCGNLKEVSKENLKEKPKIETPVEGNLNIPDFSTILKSAIKIVLALLFLYMCYIFYQIYGETLFTIYNYIEYCLVMIFAWVKAYIIVRHDAKENYNFMIKEYIRNNATAKFERVSAKIKAS